MQCGTRRKNLVSVVKVTGLAAKPATHNSHTFSARHLTRQEAGSHRSDFQYVRNGRLHFDEDLDRQLINSRPHTSLDPRLRVNN